MRKFSVLILIHVITTVVFASIYFLMREDDNFNGLDNQYLIGMSVPPVMTANIATEIYNQWLNKLGV